MSTSLQAKQDAPSHEGEAERPKPLGAGRAVLIVAVGLVLAVVFTVLGIVPRLRAQKQLAQQTNAAAAPDVLIAKPTVGKPDDTLMLPGALQAYVEAPIYARTSGYLRRWYFDIGAHVRKGQMLAVIESPEVDEQLRQARADLATFEANAGNAQIQARRYQALLDQNAVSAQDRDTFVTSQVATNTQVQSARANVQRLEALVGFERVYAPVDGVVTARYIDTGQLINAGAGAQLFSVAQESTLRVYVSVPQVDSLGAKRGVPAQISMAEYPGRTFTGHIVRTADAIDPTTRTLLVEVDVDNRKGELKPGAYGMVTLHLNTGVQTMIIPVPTLIFRAQGLQVATVVNGKTRLVPVTVGQDDGRVVQIVTGLTADAEVIQNPPDSILDGEAVHIVQPKNAQGSSGTGSQGAQQQTGSQQTGQEADSAATKQSGGGK